MSESEDTGRIRINNAKIILSDNDNNEDIYVAEAKYLRGSILETVFRDFLNSVRKEKAIDSSKIVAGGSYSITVEVKETTNIDTLERNVCEENKS